MIGICQCCGIENVSVTTDTQWRDGKKVGFWDICYLCAKSGTAQSKIDGRIEASIMSTICFVGNELLKEIWELKRA